MKASTPKPVAAGWEKTTLVGSRLRFVSLFSLLEVLEVFEGDGEGADAGGAATLCLLVTLGAADMTSLLKAACCFSRKEDIMSGLLYRYRGIIRGKVFWSRR